jgi:hypothetical protein
MSTSVLIVNFRAYEDLERCLQSLDGQLRAGDEVIVLDNESQPALAAAVGRKFPVATIIPSDVNLGFAAGVNIAARHARNPFLLLLNPDTVVEGPLLVVLEEYLASHPDTAVVGPRVVNGDGSIQPSARAFPGFSTLLGGRSAWFTRQYPDNPWARRNLLGLTARAPLRVDWLSGSCLMTRRDVFERLGGFDESFFSTGKTPIIAGVSLIWACTAPTCRACRSGISAADPPATTSRGRFESFTRAPTFCTAANAASSDAWAPPWSARACTSAASSECGARWPWRARRLLPPTTSRRRHPISNRSRGVSPRFGRDVTRASRLVA